MWKKPRFCRVQDMIYPDRCMLKWQGMLLSDHNERIHIDAQAEFAEREDRFHTEAQYEDWDSLIEESRRSHLPLTLLVARPGEREFMVRGVIRSIRKNRLCVLTDQGEIFLERHEIGGIEE